MESKHTKGPWQNDPLNLGVLGDISDSAGNTIAQAQPVIGDKDHSIRQANARLMAAAPDMFEAIVELLATHPAAYRDPGPIDNRTDNAIKIARAALAKARGQ